MKWHSSAAYYRVRHRPWMPTHMCAAHDRSGAVEQFGVMWLGVEHAALPCALLSRNEGGAHPLEAHSNSRASNVCTGTQII